MDRVAIVGFGCAGYHCLKALSEADTHLKVDVYTDTTLPPYNPMLTTYYIAGKLNYEGMFPFGSKEDIKKKYDFTLHSSCNVSHVSGKIKTISLSDGTERQYDRILISTGAKAFLSPIGPLPTHRLFTMRSVSDAIRLKEALDSGAIRSAIVVGASMVGIKVAELLKQHDVNCTLVDIASHIFCTAAFNQVSEKIEERISARGVSLRFGIKIDNAAEKNGMVITKYSDGTIQSTDAIIMCVGTTPNIGLIDKEQIKINRGIVVDDTMQTSAEGIYAAGDCCEGTDLMLGSSRIIGLWANAGYQGRTAGMNMAGIHTLYRGNILHNLTHFMDMDFISIGDKHLPGEEIVFLDTADIYIQATVKDGQIQCVNILDNYRISGVIKNYIIKQVTVPDSPPIPAMEAILLRNGLNYKFIDFLGGKGHE